MRIVRELVDALAYAHRNGVVHRDIKPENVLMSEGHAVVTDFGVAKAVSSSSGGQLTSLGLALGTPAYMAPEQAAADPHVDHRADLYSIGVVAYEMLAGRTPFAAASPQAMLAAHITQAPDPLEQHRRSVPPALSAVVMRCLEKHAADRWQSAAEVSAQLESIPLETSGGHAPTGAQLAASSGTEAAIRRGHPMRVTALFLAASAGMLGLTYFLVQRLGLPDWVFTAAVALLLLGLPIMVLAGLHERRRAQARTGGMTVATPEGLAPWTSWRRAMMGGAMAFAGLGVLATGYTAMRLLGIGPVGTLVASGVLEEREPLILADFENRTPDSTLGQSLTEAFRVDLSQSPTLRLVDPGSLVETLERMERRGPATLNPALAREVAERDGREGGRRRADRSGGPRLRALGEPGRCRGRADPHRGARIRRRRRFAPRCDRPALPEASRADRRVAHDDPRGPAAGGCHDRIAGGTAQVHRREPADRERPGRGVGAAARRGRGTGHRVCHGLAQAGRHDGQLRAVADP